MHGSEWESFSKRKLREVLLLGEEAARLCIEARRCKHSSAVTRFSEKKVNRT